MDTKKEFTDLSLQEKLRFLENEEPRPHDFLFALRELESHHIKELEQAQSSYDMGLIYPEELFNQVGDILSAYNKDRNRIFSAARNQLGKSKDFLLGAYYSKYFM